MTYHKHIDGLRALAVMVVLLMHLGLRSFSGGFVGVDVFFVISGFLISRLIVDELDKTQQFSFLRFYCRRSLRILPALLVTLCVSFLVAVIALNQGIFVTFGKTMAAAAAAVSNIFLYHETGYFNIFSQMNPLLHTWSLGVEEQFYVIWPLLLLGVYGLAKSNKHRALGLCFIGVFALSLAANMLFQNQDLDSLFYWMPYRAFEFCIGASCVLLMHKEYKLSNALLEFLCLLGLAMILFPVFYYDKETLFPSYNALLPTVGSALLICAGSSRYVGAALRFKPIRHIGLISYSLYLIHWPLIVFVCTIKSSLGYKYPLSSWSMCFVALASLVLAHVMYRWVEQPFRKKMSPDRKKQKRILGFSLLSVAVLVGCGLSMMSAELWRWRLSSGNLKTIKSVNNYRKEYWGGAGFDIGYVYHGKTDKPQLVLFGDSHSSMLSQGIVDYIAKPYAVTTYLISGALIRNKYPSCLSLPGVVRKFARGKEYKAKQCEALWNDALAVLKQSPHSVLMMSFAYKHQFTQTIDKKTGNTLVAHPGNSANYDAFIAAIDRLKKRMGDRELILIGAVPQSSYLPNKCLVRRTWVFHQNTCDKKDSINRVPTNRVINKVLSAYADKHQHVHFINPYDVFCSQGYCSNINKDNIPYYSDGDHLSKTGSRYFIQKKQTVIRDILKESSS